MDQAWLTDRLDSCLLSDTELACERLSFMQLPDPFPAAAVVREPEPQDALVTAG
jgi:hypothetical protein